MNGELKEYKVNKVFNNNVIWVTDIKTQEEAVLVGKGIGFGLSKEQMAKINTADIERQFYFFDKSNYQQYKGIINYINKRIIGVSEEIIAMVCRELGEPLNEHIHVALADHINFTLERLEGNLEITNPFLVEIQTLYPTEYRLASKAAEIIRRELGIDIPEGEKGFIAMHIHAARVNREVSRTVKYTSLINKMVNIIEGETGIKLDKNGMNYARLITHMRFAIERMEKDIQSVNPLLERIESEFPTAFSIAEKLGRVMEERFEKPVPKEELGYLAIHLQRIILAEGK
ncbi:PtsGHI operon antiterminator [Koleobacter methoxysyntrophicus]|uniref:PtsGHI operon antiterminator n=1 Tax=Koleobacter methoxysyntrophicus TaxID=2751313 RepID=A0A8A0RPK6_9FIRM|nr:PRD domain-containing protein [Koleobacter methoxysyntrophicus]QSQ09146.1 PtsGHI operon antiterminator [Koleobacter methoxysyntrophicus]